MNSEGGGTAVRSAEVAAAYDASAAEWADGPARMYAALAEALVGAAKVLTSGTLAGCASRIVSADLAMGMLRHCGQDLHPVAADAARLPFGDHGFDLVLAAFSLSHLPDLPAGLTEIRRVGGALAASAFAPDWTHPAKDAVDQTLTSFGYRSPAWHGWLKSTGEPAAGDPEGLAAQARAAGFAEVRVRPMPVRTGLSAPADLVSWRLGMAQVAPFVRGLQPPVRAGLREAAERAVAAAGGGPLTVTMLALTAR